MRDEFEWFDGMNVNMDADPYGVPRDLPDPLKINTLLDDGLVKDHKVFSDRREPGPDASESRAYGYGCQSDRVDLPNPEFEQMLKIRPYDSMRMPFRPKHSVRLPSGLPPRHIIEAYGRSEEGLPRCEECNRTEDNEGVIRHEGWCSHYGPCPRCGSTNKSAEGFGAYASHCNDCGYDVSLF